MKENNSRTINSIKNSLTSLIGNGISFLIAFISQAIFIRLLGAEYLGLNGLFTNILSMLNIFELGIGNAIVFNLYKPIAENNFKLISALMKFYKKTYYIIALIIFVFGLLLFPFISLIVGDISVDVNIYIVYFLFLISTVTSYFMVYKRNLVIANQKNYIINIFHTVYLIILSLSQLLILYFTKNYYLYLVIKIVCQFLENMLVSLYISKKYKYINFHSSEKISETVEKDIFSRVKALFFHKIGAMIVLGTDNIIISKFFGIVSVGLYNNYYVIVNGITTLFSQVISTTTSSVGNFLLSINSEKRFDVFKKMRFLNSWISIFTGVSLLVIIQPFISVWVGKKYLLDNFVVFTIVFNYFQTMQISIYNTFKDSAGIWREDKFVPLLQALLNIVCSIIFLHIFGLAGIFIGTIVSGFVLWFYSYPKFIYKNLFNRSYVSYLKETIGYVMVFVFIAVITYTLSLFVRVDTNYLQVIINVFICLVVPNILMIIIFRKNDNYKYFKDLFFKVLYRFLKKNKI